MGYKGSNWTRGELGHEPPSAEEVASEFASDYREDDRSLEELREDLDELKEEMKEKRVEINARKETAEDIIEKIKEIPEEAEKMAEGNPYDKEKGYEHAVQRLVRDIEGKYMRDPAGPTKKMKERSKLEALVMGGEIVEEDKDPEEVLG